MASPFSQGKLFTYLKSSTTSRLQSTMPMKAPYLMLKYGHFTGAVRSGEMVYGYGSRSKGQDFTKNLKFFGNKKAIIETI